MGESVYTGWMYRGRRPPDDAAYLANMARCVFQSGMSWAIVASKWPAFVEAFEGFDVAKVAGYGAGDIARLKGDSHIVRNRRKILATIHNAREMERIEGEHGSVAAWLDSLDRSNNYAGVIRRVLQTFKHLGSTSAPLWLYSVGEPIDVDALVKSRFG